MKQLVKASLDSIQQHFQSYFDDDHNSRRPELKEVRKLRVFCMNRHDEKKKYNRRKIYYTTAKLIESHLPSLQTMIVPSKRFERCWTSLVK